MKRQTSSLVYFLSHLEAEGVGEGQHVTSHVMLTTPPKVEMTGALP